MSGAMAPEAYEMHRQRVLLASRPEERMIQTYKFILGCHQLAIELEKISTYRREGHKMYPETLSAERYIEDQIRAEFRKRFGCEMGMPIIEANAMKGGE